MNVHQVLSGAGPRDAITAEARAFRRCFDAWQWGGGDHAARIAPGLEPGFAGLESLAPAQDDVMLIHHSAALPELGRLLRLPGRRLLLHHNITPARWLWEQSPIVAAHCALGREQLPALVAGSHVTAADSAFNASELVALGASGAEVLPLLVDLEPLGPPDPGPRGTSEPAAPHVVFVGRLSPHKRQDRVIEAFAWYRRARAPRARLTLVGEPLTVEYAEHLSRLGAARAPGAIDVRSGLSPIELGDVYRSADVFLCLSEHEGFCVPLIEAFHHGVPVIARPVGAIAEVTDGAALLVDDDDPAVVAELIHLAAADSELREELTRRGRARLQAFAPETVSAQLRALILATAEPSPRDAVGQAGPA